MVRFLGRWAFVDSFKKRFYERSAMNQVCVKHEVYQDEQDITPNLKELKETMIILSPKSSTLIGTEQVLTKSLMNQWKSCLILWKDCYEHKYTHELQVRGSELVKEGGMNGMGRIILGVAGIRQHD